MRACQAVALCCLLLATAHTCCGAKQADSSGSAGSDVGSSDVITLTTENIAERVETQTAPALVVFVVRDNCEQCHQILPVIARVAANLKGIATVGTVDCSTVPAVRTCRAYNAMGFPKVLVFKPGTKVNPYTGGSMKDFSDFTGAVSPKTLITAVTDTLDSSHLLQLNTTAQHDMLLQQDPKLAKVLLFTDKPTSTVLAKGLSWAYARRLVFAEVRPSGDEGKTLAAKYGVEKYPTILVVKTDGGSEVYSGPLKAPELRTFLDTFALQEPLAAGADAGKGAGVSDPLGHLGQLTVHSLDAANLTDIDRQDDMWLLGFYAAAGDDACAPQLDELRKVLGEVQGIVNYGTVNTTGMKAELLEPIGLDTAAFSASPCSPQLVLLPYGEFKQSKGKYSKWSGALDNAKALQEWILKKVPDFTSTISNEVEAQSFLDASFSDLPKAPKVSSPKEREAPIGKVLLFTSKDEVPGIYKALAAQFTGKSRLLFAWTKVDSDGPAMPLMQKMNVRKAPAMTILFPLPPKPLGAEVPEDVPNTQRDNMAMQQYMGPLKFQKMLAWLTAMSTLTGMSYQAHAGATEGPAPEHFEIRTQTQLQSACYDKPGLCMITLLDGHSEAVNQHRDTVKKAAAAHAGQPVNWVVVDVARQPSFRRAYGFTGDQLPALLALSTKRMRFAQGAAPFSEASAKQLVSKVLLGTAVTLPLPDLPALVDGGEAEEDVVDVEEEFKLDDIMSEEVKDLYRKEERLKQADEELAREEQEKKQQKKKKKKSSKKKSKKKISKQKAASQGTVKDEL